MPQYIAFDIGHKPRGNLKENFTELHALLTKNDFICNEYFEATITQETLKGYDILVFSCPDFSKISRQEILEIENWVKDDGGGLLLLSHAGGDKGRNSNLSELAELFGMSFENDQVLDNENNFGLENLPLISNFTPPHPITSGIREICYRAGCSLSIIGNGIPIANSNDTSDPFSTPLICVSEPERGRVCCCGSYEIFRDKIGGGISYDTHSQLALNIFQWLISDYRFESQLSSTKQKSKPQIENVINKDQLVNENIVNQSISYTQTSSDISSTDYNFSSKQELLSFLQNLLTQVNGMREIIEKLIKYSNLSDNIFNEITLSKLPEKKKTAKPSSQKTKIKIPKKSEKENLHNELHSLERKLNSMENLLSFIKKNYNSGKMDANTYDKQNVKLSSEMDSIKIRIAEINQSLGNKS